MVPYRFNNVVNVEFATKTITNRVSYLTVYELLHSEKEFEGGSC
jgi:hypothetical protein